MHIHYTCIPIWAYIGLFVQILSNLSKFMTFCAFLHILCKVRLIYARDLWKRSLLKQRPSLEEQRQSQHCKHCKQHNKHVVALVMMCSEAQNMRTMMFWHRRLMVTSKSNIGIGIESLVAISEAENCSTS